MKCHYITDPKDGKQYLIPGCEQGWWDDKMCVCRLAKPPKQPTAEQRLIKELEAENARLNRLIRNILKRRK
jgi:hypothetical protein